VLKNLLKIPKRSAAGVDDQTVEGLRPPPAAIAPSDELEINLLFDGFD
jgi:hypothetical protein